MKKLRDIEKLRNLPIRKKLKLSHGSILALTTVIVLILLIGMGNIRSKVGNMYSGPVTNIDAIGNVRVGLVDLQRSLNRLLLKGGLNLKTNYAGFETIAEENIELVVSSMDILDKHLWSKENKELLGQMKEKMAEGEAIRANLMQLLKDGELDEANNYNERTYLAVVNEIKALSEELEVQIRDTARDYNRSANISALVLIVMGAVLLAVGIALGSMISASITASVVDPVQQITEASTRMRDGDMSAGELITYHSEDELGVLADSIRETMRNMDAYVEEISEVLKQMAEGDLTKDGDKITDFKGDFASIKDSLLHILKRFNSTLTNIQSTSHQVASNSEDLEQASHSLADGASDQASAIEELTATVDTVASMANDSAKKTQEACDGILKSTEKAEAERQKMVELTEEMQRITEISREIEKIITAIQDIASQTNLLSLNASIEAARAGEAGRGFAVVADQIGKLASDSAQSVVNTRELIAKTLEEIEKGNEITLATSEAFSRVIEDMKYFANAAQETTETAKSQALALEQVEQGIEQISNVVQHTAASSEESSAISEQLSVKSKELDELVKRFKLF